MLNRLLISSLILVMSLSFFELKLDAIERQGVTIREQFMIEQYLGNNEGLEQLVAYYYDYFFTETLFFAMGTSWAIGGDYGGYGTALIGFGYLYPLNEKSFLDIKVYSGAGGHAAIQAGGGTLVAWQFGLSYLITDTMRLDFRYGGLDYTAGSYEVNTLSLGISYFYERF